jgi:hypothetical protein
VVLRPVFGSVTAKQSLLAAFDHWGQHPPALLLGAEYHHRIEPEHVDVHGGRTRHAGTRFGNRAHHDGGLGDAEAGTAIGFRHADAEPAGVGQRLVKIMRKAALAILLQPISIIEAGADFGDRIANGFLIFREREVHVRGPVCCCC